MGTWHLWSAFRHRNCIALQNERHIDLYEQTNPYLIYEPDGVANLSKSTFTQVDDRTVRVCGSTFKHAKVPTLKIEGVKCLGFRTICPASIYDSKTIINIDEIIKVVKSFVKENTKNVIDEKDYNLDFKISGGKESSLSIIIDAVGKTQEIADTICSLARSRMLHCDYAGRKSSAGNLAFPFSPSDIHVGKVYEFSIYHLVEVDSLLETAKIEVLEI